MKRDDDFGDVGRLDAQRRIESVEAKVPPDLRFVGEPFTHLFNAEQMGGLKAERSQRFFFGDAVCRWLLAVREYDIVLQLAVGDERRNLRILAFEQLAERFLRTRRNWIAGVLGLHDKFSGQGRGCTWKPLSCARECGVPSPVDAGGEGDCARAKDLTANSADELFELVV